MFLLVRKSKKFWENVRNWAKMYTFIVDTYFSILDFFGFFLDSNYLNKLFGRAIGPFFRFFVLYGRKIHFCITNDNKSEKIQKMYTFIVDTYFSILFFFRFFLDSNYLYKLFGRTIGPFFRFFVLYGRKMHFLVSNIAQFC